jgi:hypothetical protein
MASQYMSLQPQPSPQLLRLRLLLEPNLRMLLPTQHLCYAVTPLSTLLCRQQLLQRKPRRLSPQISSADQYASPPLPLLRTPLLPRQPTTSPPARQQAKVTPSLRLPPTQASPMQSL